MSHLTIYSLAAQSEQVMGPPEWIAGANPRAAHDGKIMTIRNEEKPVP